MTKCYYTIHKGERFLIPGCMTVVQSYDISDCTCPINKKSLEERVYYLEKEIRKLKKVFA